ncbi:hypothetical protein [Empedobacter sp.]|uniref:hypothetical protein n=1 Tax=Empedobacter sp. TaxID=1927715 RepID=UPI0028A74E0D|nr:hypothetical protein [Empedobacter sp.]
MEFREKMKDIFWYLRRFIIDFIKINRLKKYYSNKNRLLNVNKKMIIYMADGKMLHGGLSDRLCGIVSAYACSKDLGLDFKILFESPYSLSDYLKPNLINWEISKDEVSFNRREAEATYIPYYSKSHNFQKKISKKRLKSNLSQVHVYTNMRYFTKSEFKSLFNELFKLSESLKDKIEFNKSHLPNKYISITFRFQQLLGDFEEGNFPKIETVEEKENLIKKCINKIEQIKRENPTYHKILVTSDSKIFLNRVEELDYTYTIPGDIVHMDFVDKKDLFEEHLKSFVDLFMIGNADKIYLANFSPLYQSTFPKTAAFLNNSHYFEIKSEG